MQVIWERKRREFYGILINSSDVKWEETNKNIMESKLKVINNQVTLNTLDSKESLDSTNSFLKEA